MKRAPNLLMAALRACMLLVASCERSPPQYFYDPDGERPSAGMTQLDDFRLRYLSRGSTMYWANPDADAADRWLFGCDGNWASRGGLAPLNGSYILQNGELCVMRRERQTCHRVFESSDGFYFISGFGGDTTGETVIKVRFERDRPLDCD